MTLACCVRQGGQGEGRADTLLRITVQEKTKEVTIKLEGRIAGPWVDELRRTWTSLVPSLESKDVCVDICEVTFVDAPGKQLVTDIRKGGARFRADTAIMKYLIEEIERDGRRKQGESTCADYGAKQPPEVSTGRNAGHEELEMTGQRGRGLKTDGADFGGFVDRYAGLVYWLAFCVTGDGKNAEEVLEKTFLTARSGFEDRKEKESPVMRLARIAVSEAFAKRRIPNTSERPSVDLEAEDEGAFAPREIVDWGHDPEKRYTTEERRKIAQDGIQTVPPLSRMVFLLRDVAKLRTEEIAEVLHLPVPSAKSRLLRSRLQLREHLNEYFKPTPKEGTQIG